MDKKDKIKQRLKERTASKRYKLSEGDNTFRVLPNKLGEDHLDFFEYGMHSNVGPQNRYVRCGKSRSGKGDCWLCDKIAELSESKKSSHRAAAEKMARVDKFATQISPISDGTWLPPTLFEMPNSVANGLLGIMHRKAVTDLKKGYNLTVDRVGTTFKGTKYGSLVVDDETSKVPSKIVESMKTFEELVAKYSEAKQKEAYYGHEQEDDEDDEEVTKKPAADDDEEEEEKPKKKKKPADDDEEEPDEEDSEFEELAEEEEEDEKPKKKKKTDDDEEDEPVEDEEDEAPKKKKKPADDDDEGEEVEEDDEDEAPKKKKKKSEDEDEEEPEEDEEEEKPKKKKKPADDDDEEAPEEEEEEEDEKPKKKKKKPVDDDEDE